MGLLVLVFLAVTFGMLFAYELLAYFLHRDAARVHRRITREFQRELLSESAGNLFKNLDELSSSLDTMTDIDVGASGMSRAVPKPAPEGWTKRLEKLLQQADVACSAGRFLVGSAALGLALGTPLLVLVNWIAALAACLVGLALPLVIVTVKRSRRRNGYLRQLPNAFDLMARILRAGQSVPQSLQAVSEAFEEPLASEFANCQHHQNLGVRPEVTYQELAQRSGILELRIFVMAMSIQQRLGGSLSDVLERLSGLIRQRLRLRDQVQALTAEGRLQGLTLVVLPFVVFGIMMVVNRHYAQTLLDHHVLVGVTLACMAAGMLWIRKIVDIQY